MRHLKLFEELNSATYKLAAQKLRDMGHVRRPDDLYNWGNHVRELEVRKRWERFGSYKMDLIDYIYDSKTRTKPDRTPVKEITDNNFYLAISLDYDSLRDTMSDWLTDIDRVGKGNLWFQFSIGIIPSDEKSRDFFKSNNSINHNLYDGVYWSSYLSFELSKDDNKINPTGVYNIDTYDGYETKFSDRKNAMKFWRFLCDLFDEKFTINTEYNKVGDIARIKNLIIEKTGDIEGFLRLKKSIRNMSLSGLFID